MLAVLPKGPATNCGLETILDDRRAYHAETTPFHTERLDYIFNFPSFAHLDRFPLGLPPARGLFAISSFMGPLSLSPKLSPVLLQNTIRKILVQLNHPFSRQGSKHVVLLVTFFLTLLRLFVRFFHGCQTLLHFPIPHCMKRVVNRILSTPKCG